MEHGHTHLPDYNTNTKADWTNVTKPSACDAKANNNGDFHGHRMRFYDENAEKYDEDHKVLQYNGARYVAITAHKYLNGNEEAEILDVGAGTGLVVEEMRKLGSYKNVSAVDPSAEMLKVGMEKGFFKQTFVQYFDKNSNLPQDTYDAIVTSGAFCPGHMRADSVEEMCRLLKKGGFFCLGLRERNMETDEDFKTLRPRLQNLVDEGICERWEDSVVPGWNSNLPGCILVYKKI